MIHCASAIIFIRKKASGKSSFYAKQFEQNYIRINLDTLNTRNNEASLMQKCMQDRSSFVVDNTNPTKADRRWNVTIKTCVLGIIQTELR